MMPGVVAGFPRGAPGRYSITSGTDGSGAYGYQGADYAGSGAFGAVTPPRPNVDPSSSGGAATTGEMMALSWDDGLLNLVVRGEHTAANQYPFATMTIGGVSYAKTAISGFGYFGGYSAASWRVPTNPFPAGAQVQVVFT